MNKLLFSLIALLMASQAWALIPESKLSAPNVDGPNVKRIARVTYDTSTVGFGSSTVNSGAHQTGVVLPKNSIITDSYLYVKTQLTSSGAATIAFKCEDANNIFTATNITSSAAGTILSGANYGADSSGAANMTGGIAAACRITGTVGVADLTAGKVILFVEYVVAE